MGRIAVVMIDGVADWEIGPVLPAAREWFGDEVAIASIDGRPVTSIGGLRIHPAHAMSDFAPLDADLWILPGSERWQQGEIPALSAALRERVEHDRAIAAICGATLAFGHAGLLDARPHTSNSLEFLQHNLPGYTGAAHYRAQPTAVAEGGLITAAGSSPMSFALACLRQLHPDREDGIAEMRAMFAAEYATA